MVGIAAGFDHAVAQRSDGTVWAWGDNSNGQLGDGTTTGRTTALQVTGLSGVVGLAAGKDDTVALKVDNTFWAWGSNNKGQLGDGTTTDRLTPVSITVP